MRYIVLLLIVGSSWLLSATVQQMQSEKRYALIVANGLVSETDDDKAIVAAKKMESFLKARGFKTVTAYNEERSDLIKTYRAFSKEVTPNAVIALVYSGRTITYDKQTWMLPAAMNLESLKQLRLAAVSFNFLLTELLRHRPRVALGVIDGYAYTAKKNQTNTTTILSSFGAIQEADILVKYNGKAKTAGFLSQIVATVGKRDDDIATVARKLERSGAKSQIGVKAFYFNVPTKILTAEEKAWQRAVAKNSVVGYEAFLIAFPDSRYKQTAIERIDTLNARKKSDGSANAARVSSAQERKLREKTEALKKMEAELKAQQAALEHIKMQQTAVSKKKADVPVVTKTHYMEPVEMVTIPAGVYLMGSDAFENAKPVHMVKVEKPFKMSAFEVTNKEYAYYLKATGVKYRKRKLLKNESAPVVYVSWEEANRYAKWLSKMTGKHYRLPTEAEWEYAARAGSDTLYIWGDNPALAPQYAWMAINAHGFVHSGGLLQPNAFGLYDMAGNVAEWCLDAMMPNYSGAPSVSNRAVVDPDGMKVFRGGSYLSEGEALSPSYRNSNIPIYRSKEIGFRLVESL